MEFKKGSTYTRNEIHMLYFGKPVPKTGTGDWTTGYVRVENELIVFMNINIPGTTGHDFPNHYDETNKTIVWYGKPDTHSGQSIFHKIINGRNHTPLFCPMGYHRSFFIPRNRQRRIRMGIQPLPLKGNLQKI